MASDLQWFMLVLFSKSNRCLLPGKRKIKIKNVANSQEAYVLFKTQEGAF